MCSTGDVFSAAIPAGLECEKLQQTLQLQISHHCTSFYKVKSCNFSNTFSKYYKFSTYFCSTRAPGSGRICSFFKPNFRDCFSDRSKNLDKPRKQQAILEAIFALLHCTATSPGGNKNQSKAIALISHEREVQLSVGDGQAGGTAACSFVPQSTRGTRLGTDGTAVRSTAGKQGNHTIPLFKPM